jgi:hypothetical protein
MASRQSEREGGVVTELGFRGAQLRAQGDREPIYRFMTYGSLAVGRKSARIEFHKEPSPLEIVVTFLTAGFGGALLGRALVRVPSGMHELRVGRKDVERVLIDRAHGRIAMKAAPWLGDRVLPMGWLGMQTGSIPEPTLEALRAAFGDKLQQQALPADFGRALVMAVALLILLALAALAGVFRR